MKREVHHRLEMRIKTILVRIAALPVSKLRNRSCPDLTDNVEVRILIHHSSAPLGHRILLIVRISVHSESVKTRPLYPPDSPLLEISENIRVVEVHIHHRSVEPAALLNVKVLLGSIRIHIGREGNVRTGVSVEHMIPILERSVLHPPVSRTRMIRNDIHNDLEILLVSLLYILLEKIVCTETRVDMIIICTSISVVRVLRLVILEKRCTPDCSGTKTADVVKIIDDTLKVTTVTSKELVTGIFVRSILCRIVAGIAVCKAVWHDEVDHISSCETLAFSRSFLARSDFVRIFK